jgi:hypothetical protein
LAKETSFFVATFVFQQFKCSQNAVQRRAHLMAHDREKTCIFCRASFSLKPPVAFGEVGFDPCGDVAQESYEDRRPLVVHVRNNRNFNRVLQTVIASKFQADAATVR